MSHIYNGLRVQGTLNSDQKRAITMTIKQLEKKHGIHVVMNEGEDYFYERGLALAATWKKAASRVSAPVRKVEREKYVGCAYGSPECEGRTFRSNGSGMWGHTSCKQGQEYLDAR